ncbi:hypothetical protein PAA8504_03841 [Palleronia abyssalis]|uniref:Uncharacterized protein n=1 Tax=Palleronia abyssalis TaxID=1501240 RepID=A0A2R8C0P5_9RHOB|nr:hypothetical protein PAA8504_03841 [Palleronia abyssalis]
MASWGIRWFRDDAPVMQAMTVVEVQARFADSRCSTDVSAESGLGGLTDRLPYELRI